MSRVANVELRDVKKSPHASNDSENERIFYDDSERAKLLGWTYGEMIVQTLVFQVFQNSENIIAA